jgi:hypothetical protein
VPQYQGYWVDWMILPRGAPAGAAPEPSPDAYRYNSDWYRTSSRDSDLTCDGACGLGAFPVHLPLFAAANRDRALAERAALVTGAVDGDGHPRALPNGTISVWDEALAYAGAHPRDPRSPELLYWLIHVARWGGNRDHLGRRAFLLLHARYPASSWARRSRYYYDDPVYPH